MFEKIKNLAKHPYFQQFKDVRAVGLAVFGLIALMVTWSGIKAVQTNYTLQKQISRLEQENQVSQLENDNQKLQNQYYNTNQYLELASRQYFGKASPGETVLIVPKEVALRYAPQTAVVKTASRKKSYDKPTYQKNFEAWIDFFLHRSTGGI